MALERLLVPVDFSECSWAALTVAADLARRVKGRLELLHVWQMPAFLPPESVVGTVGAPSQPLAELLQASAEAAMQELVARARGQGIEVGAGVVVAGEPARVILDRARSGQYDLLVLGTHGRGLLAHLLLGSVAEKVVRLSPVPVLTVRNALVS